MSVILHSVFSNMTEKRGQDDQGVISQPFLRSVYDDTCNFFLIKRCCSKSFIPLYHICITSGLFSPTFNKQSQDYLRKVCFTILYIQWSLYFKTIQNLLHNIV